MGVVLLVAALIATPAFADTSPTGAYLTSVSIEVPPHHGIEPQLALSYDSTAGDRWLGVGWGLSGLSGIERTSGSRGAPNYDSTDAFLLDGTELVPCTQGMQSPSCLYPPPSDGSHDYVSYAAKLENFERIAFDRADAGTGNWYIWSKTGTKLTFEPRRSTASRDEGDVASWDLSTVEDTVGNLVRYHYAPELTANPAPDPGKHTYLSYIAYADANHPEEASQARITFYGEDRPDPISSANGRAVDSMAQRLKTVDVTVGSERARAYKLTYETATTSTGRSILIGVQEFGRDAELDSSGTVIGGTALPTIRFAPPDPKDNQVGIWEPTASKPVPWDLSAPALAPGKPKACTLFSGVDPSCGSPRPSGPSTFPGDKAFLDLGPSSSDRDNPISPALQVGDYDGDGRLDWMQASWFRTYPNIRFLTSSHMGAPVKVDVEVIKDAPNFDPQTLQSWAMDLDGGGRTDFLLGARLYDGATTSPGEMDLIAAFSVGDGTFRLGSPQSTGWATGVDTTSPMQCKPADVNSDGRQDLVCVYSRSGRIGTALALGDGTFEITSQQLPAAVTDFEIADVNGDGLPDVIAWNATTLIVGISGGNGQFQFSQQPFAFPQGTIYTHPKPLVGDVTGTGRPDLVWLLPETLQAGNESFTDFYYAVQVAVGQPDSTFLMQPLQLLPTELDITTGAWLGDANGDGKADLLISTPGSFWQRYGIDTVGQKCDDSVLSKNLPFLGRIFSAGDGTFQLPPRSGWDTCDAWSQFPRDAFGESFGSDDVQGAETVVADVNSDGLDDFVIAAPDILLNDIPTYGGIRVVDNISPPTYEDVRDWRLGDFTGHGQSADMAYVTQDASGVQVFTSLAGSSTVERQTYFPPSSDVPQAAEDADNRHWVSIDVGSPAGGLDGKSDLVRLEYAGQGGLRVYTLLANGDGTWTPGNHNKPQDFQVPDLLADDTLRAKTADVNGDGSPDLVLTHFEAPGVLRVYTLFSRLDGSWSDPVVVDVSIPPIKARNAVVSLNAADAQNVVALDLKGDGRTGLAVTQFIPGDLLENGIDVPGVLWVNLLTSNWDGTWEIGNSPLHVETAPHAPWIARRVIPLDFNGDGKSDLAVMLPPTPISAERQSVDPFSGFSIALLVSNGSAVNWSTESPPVADPTGLALYGSGRWLPMDINRDGRTGLIQVHRLPDKSYVQSLIPTGDTWKVVSFPIDSLTVADANELDWQPGDFNLDGAADLVQPTFALLPGYFANGQLKMDALVSRAPSDLTETFGNGLGGATHVSYGSAAMVRADPASDTSKCYLPDPTISVVSAVAIDDGRGTAPDVQHLDYRCPRWSLEERRFLGWEAVDSSRDAAVNRPQVLTRLHYTITDHGNVLLDDRQVRDANSNMLTDAQTRYSIFSLGPPGSCQASLAQDQGVQGACTAERPPFRAVAESQLKSRCSYGVGSSDPAPPAMPASCDETQTDNSYDSFDNATQIVEYGGTRADHRDAAVERTTLNTYAVAPGPYLMGLASSKKIFAGTPSATGDLGAMASSTRSCYDGLTECSTEPTQGLLTAQYVWNDQTGEELPTSFEYDAFGNQSRTIDANDAATTTHYDEELQSYPINICNALGQCSQKRWDAAIGKVLVETGPNGETTLHQYDALAREVLTQYPNGGARHRDYDDNDLGNPTQQHIREWVDDGSVDGLWSEIYLDGLGRTYSTIAKGDETGVTFVQDTVYRDASANPYTRSHPYALGGGSPNTPVLETMSYDEVSRLLRLTHADGSYRQDLYTHDDGGAWTTTFDEVRHKKATLTDRDGHLRQVVEAHDGTSLTTSYSYDTLGSPTQVTDSAGHVTTTTKWNSLGQKLAQTDLDMGTWTYNYDRVGSLVQRMDAKGIETTFEYDALRRPIAEWWTHPNGLIVLGAKWTYDETANHGDGIGRLTSTSDTTGAGCAKQVADDPYGVSEGLTYDAMGQITGRANCILGSMYSMTFGYDSVGTGRQHSVTYPDGEIVDSTYDAAGRVDGLFGRSDPTPDPTNYVATIKYDAAGRPIDTGYGNGTEEYRVYQPQRDWTVSERLALGNHVLYGATYSYGRSGLVDSSTSSTNKLNLEYQYDDLNRVAIVAGDVTQSFRYDNLGNIRFNSDLGDYRYDEAAPHAVTRVGDSVYAYDPNGNMTLRGGTSIAWNDNDRPEWIEAKDGTWTHALYDATGTRVLKVHPGDGVHQYLGNFADVSISDDDAVAPKLTKYYYVAGRLVAKNDGDKTTWYLTDRLGSIRLTTDKDGNVVARPEYTVFGGSPNEVEGTPVGSSQPGFGGQMGDPESGLIYLTGRYYDPVLGRFLSGDSIVPDASNPQALNRYSFVYNTPTAVSDPSGHMPPTDNNDQKWRDWYWAQSLQANGFALSDAEERALGQFSGGVDQTQSAQVAVPDAGGADVHVSCASCSLLTSKLQPPGSSLVPSKPAEAPTIPGSDAADWRQSPWDTYYSPDSVSDAIASVWNGSQRDLSPAVQRIIHERQQAQNYYDYNLALAADYLRARLETLKWGTTIAEAKVMVYMDLKSMQLVTPQGPGPVSPYSVAQRTWMLKGVSDQEANQSWYTPLSVEAGRLGHFFGGN